jgi:hypothetical protein
MKISIQGLTRIILMVIVMFVVMKVSPVQQVQASEKTDQLETSYINVSSKYLYLGISGKNTFDFNINKKVISEVQSCIWYIAEDKGNPKAVKLNPDNGVVTAKSAGTAYLRCEIILTNGTVINPEAKVVVINNITEVEIGNIPENKTVPAGVAYDFNEKILNTTAGKNVKTSGITRWEIENDTTGAKVDDDGAVIPKIGGVFSIRAVCFQSIQAYEAWLVNKAANGKSITAASDWVTITSIASIGQAETQAQLEALLSDKYMKQITIVSGTEQKLSIPKGDYSDKSLIVDVKNTGITNNGVFKLITLKSVSDSTWEENAINNSIEMYDCMLRLVITDKAQVKSIKFGKNSEKTIYENNINKKLSAGELALMDTFTTAAVRDAFNIAELSANGKIDQIEITAASSIYFFGAGKIDQVIVEETAGKTKIAAATKTNVESNAEAAITLLNGAEGTEFNIAEDTAINIENLSTGSVGLHYNKSSFVYLTPGYAFIAPRKEEGYYNNRKNSASSVIKLYPIATESVSTTSLIKGQKLWFSNLKGTFNVSGILSWALPDLEISSGGYFMWKFTPTDTDHFKVVYGYIKVDVIN